VLNKSGLMMIGVLLLVAGAAAGGTWAYMNSRGTAPATRVAAHVEPKQENREFRYVTLDKVIVMLRDDNGGPAAHYLSTDLVFRTTEESEKKVKEQLPYLRSVTVATLSSYSTGKAGLLSVEQYRKLLADAFAAAYARDAQEKPFLDVMVGRLIIE